MSHAYDPDTEKQGQEDHCKFEGSVLYMEKFQANQHYTVRFYFKKQNETTRSMRPGEMAQQPKL